MFGSIDFGSGLDFGGGGGSVLGNFSGGYDAGGLGSWGYDFSNISDGLLGAGANLGASYGQSAGDSISQMGAGTFGDPAAGALAAAESRMPGVGTPSTRVAGFDTKGTGEWADKAPAAEKGGIGDGVKKALGISSNKEGNFDWSDPKNLDKIIKMGIGLGGIVQTMQANKAARAAQDKANQNQLQQKAAHQTWTPQQSVWANNFFNTPTNPNRGVVRAGEQGSSIVAGRGYAGGGIVRHIMKDFPRVMEELKTLAKQEKTVTNIKKRDGTYYTDADIQRAEDNDFYRKNPSTRPPEWRDPEADNYAGGGGIGALGDDRYRGTPVAPRRLDERGNIFDVTRSRRMREAGLEEEPQLLQRGNTPREVVQEYPVSDLLRSLPMLLRNMAGGERDPRAGYAEGGEIEFEEEGPTVEHGAFGLLEGEGTGQSDDLEINAARGEYIFDAETVAMIGDGSNDAGAEILDQWRANLREMKRGAPLDDIPEPAGDPMQYLPNGAI